MKVPFYGHIVEAKYQEPGEMRKEGQSLVDITRYKIQTII
jgi:hypothetical protein